MSATLSITALITHHQGKLENARKALKEWQENYTPKTSIHYSDEQKEKSIVSWGATVVFHEKAVELLKELKNASS